MKVQAAVLREPGLAGLRIETLDLDDPVEDEVLVAVVGSGLCHSDLHFVDGVLPLTSPRVLGHEVAGVVEKVGPGVDVVEVGDHVVVCFAMPCGACTECGRGAETLCLRRGEAWTRPPGARRPRLVDAEGEAVDAGSGIGGLAEKVLVHQRGVVPVPRDLPLGPLALLGCGVLTGVGAALNTARVGAGESVVVIGCGGVGLSIVQGARIAGAAEIVAIDVRPGKLAAATGFGATATVLATAGEEHVDEVQALLGGGADHVFEAVGRPECVSQALRLCGRRGLVTLAGVYADDMRAPLPLRDVLLSEKRIQGSYLGSSSIRRDIGRLADLYTSGQLLLDEMIAPRLAFDEVHDGFRALMSGDALRPVVGFPCAAAAWPTPTEEASCTT